MRVIVDFYFDDLEQHCMNVDCDFRVGPYDEAWTYSCPHCGHRVGYFRAFGTEEERSQEVTRYDARISGVDY
jgi:predicted RNA-binding Zn-ribbon protein involved in translation (DUF1610 family)